MAVLGLARARPKGVGSVEREWAGDIQGGRMNRF